MDHSRSPTPDSSGAVDELYNRDKFDRSVMAHVVGTLLAWFIGLLVFLMYKLWQDYISTILVAFIVSQTLHAQRAYIVGLLQWLRSSQSPPLVNVALGWLRKPLTLVRSAAFDVPALLQLSLLLLIFLVQDAYAWLYIGLALLGPAVALLITALVLDKKLLMTDALLSDEVLAATIVLLTLLVVLSFVGTTLAVQSVLDGMQLLVDGSTWMRNVSVEAEGPVRAVVAQGVELGMAGLEQLKRQDHQWVPAVSHLLEQVGSSDNNGTVVVMSTFGKLRECYPSAAWVSQAEDLGKLVLWLSGFHPDSPIRTSFNATILENATDGSGGGGGAAMGLTAQTLFSSKGLEHLKEEGLKIVRELDDPNELLVTLRAQLAAAWPALRETLLGSQASLLTVISSTITRALQAIQLFIAFGSSTIVFFTITFYMLSAEQDVLTLLVEKIHPAATSEMLQRMRDTVDAAIIMPISGASRNAIFLLLVYWALDLPCAHIACVGVVLFTLFPLFYAWVVCLPWVLVWCFTGRWVTGLLLLVAMVLILSGHTEREIMLQKQTGIGDYVHAFSLCLGVYVFGINGVLFGPMLVCVAKLLVDIASDLILDAEGHAGRSPANALAPADEAPGAPAAFTQRRTAAAAPASAFVSENPFGAAPAAEPPPPRPPTVRINSTSNQPGTLRKAESRGSMASHVLGTMRRLTFFSSPSGTPRSNALFLSGGGGRQVPPVQRSRTFPNELPQMPFGSPVPTNHNSNGHAAAAARSVSFSVLVGGNRTPSVVRVSALATMAGRQLYSRVESRLLSAGALPAEHAVAGLRAADGAKVVSTEDIREGETLEAQVQHVYTSSSATELPMSTSMWEHEASSRRPSRDDDNELGQSERTELVEELSPSQPASPSQPLRSPIDVRRQASRAVLAELRRAADDD